MKQAGLVGRTLVALAMAAGIGSTAQAAEKVNVGICVSWPGYAMLELAQQKNLAPDLEFNLVIFNDPIGGHLALAAGQVDVYECTGDYTPIIAERGTPVANVAFANPSYGVDHIIMSPGVDATNISGRKVGAPQAYIGHLLMGLFLDKIGVGVGDVEWVNLNADEAVGPMMSGDLAAAYLYEPWISKVVENKPGAVSGIDTADAQMLRTGIFTDVVYMNTDFIAKRRAVALATLKARYDALQYWHENTDEANTLMAEYLQWPKEDVEYVIGTNGKYFEGGIYMYDFDETARVCGALAGDPPFGLKNGSMPAVATLTNEWWVRLGLMQNMVDSAGAVDCSLVKELLDGGYRQAFSAR